MGFYTAQLNDNKIVVSVTDTAEKLVGNKFVEIDTFDIGCCGKKYNSDTKAFEDVPLTQEQIDEQAIQKEIERIKAEKDAALRVEAIANLDAAGKLSVVTE